ASKKNGHGLTNMFEVHARKFEDRVAIYCNDKGQPIGPKKARNKMTGFLGTIAHDYNWAPLTYTNWQKFPDKDKIWEYVNSKYILPPESYDWVMETLYVSWRGFKCRLKRDHCYPYETYEKRLNSRPDNVPEDHFKLLLKYWASTPTKQEMRRLEVLEADENSECKKDPFDEVMGDGRAVQVMESIKSAMVADVQKELSAKREEIAMEKEAHATRVAEMERATKEQEI
ncbi:Breast cancer type 1 susceptibility protein-like protein, partial [Bienertia sinuspersici]